MNAGQVSAIERFKSVSVQRQAIGMVVVQTRGQGFTELTERVEEFAQQSSVKDGLVTVFCRHTSASLVVQENADPDVRVDLLTAFDRLAPRGVKYVHDAEGPDDMPAHIRAMLTGCSIGVPVRDGKLTLGTWQGIYLVEHRDDGHRREIVFHIVGI